MALVRGVPDPRHAGRRRPVQVPLQRATGTTSTPWPTRSPRARGWCSSARPTTRRAPTVGDAELRGVPRAGSPDVLVVLDEAYLEFVTAAEPDALAVLRFVPTSPCCGRSRRPTGSPACGWATPWRTSRSRRRCARPRPLRRERLRPGGGGRLARGVRRARGAGQGARRRARAGARGAGRAGLGAPRLPGELRVVRLGSETAPSRRPEDAGLTVRPTAPTAREPPSGSERPTTASSRWPGRSWPPAGADRPGPFRVAVVVHSRPVQLVCPQVGGGPERCVGGRS